MQKIHTMQEHIPAGRLLKLLHKMWPDFVANRKYKELTGEEPPVTKKQRRS